MGIKDAIKILQEHVAMIDKDIESCVKQEKYEACIELKNIKRGLQFAIEDISP